MRARLYLDEDISPDVAVALRAHGYDVVSAHELGRTGLDDAEQLRFAAEEGRAILTCNYSHFAALSEQWFRAERPHSGVVISYRQYNRHDLGGIIRATATLLDTVTAEDLAGRCTSSNSSGGDESDATPSFTQAARGRSRLWHGGASTDEASQRAAYCEWRCLMTPNGS